MVAGKVKTAMGTHNSPVRSKPPPMSTPDSAAKGKKGSAAGFSRSFFPRSSAQVQPRPPDVSELIRLVEELRDRESSLKTELLQHKLLKESVAILPVLEREVSSKDCEIERFRKKIDCLEVENEQLRNENEFLHIELTKQNRKYEDKIKYMQAELCDIKRAVADAEHDETTSSSSASSSSSSMAKLTDFTNNFNKSNFSAKVLRKCVTQSSIASNFCESVNKDEFITDAPPHSRCDSEEIHQNSAGIISIRSRAPRIPKPPPRPSSSSYSSVNHLSDSADRALAEISNIPVKSAAPPPPPPPPLPALSKAAAPPPPPPPPKGAKSKVALAKVRRVPEVVEFYHSLMRRDSSCRRDTGVGSLAGAATKDMIGEIENRSSHLLAVKYFYQFFI